jgi:DNA-binding response OmpR family regulator
VRKRILIVDDDPDVVRTFTTVLEDEGFETSTARDGAQAVLGAWRGHPDLVVLDINLPRQSGVRVYRTIRADADLAHIPVLMVTGLDDGFRRFISTRDQLPPPDGYLEKPVLVADFVREVRRLLA